MALDVNALVAKAKADAAAAEKAAKEAKAKAEANKAATSKANSIQTKANQKFDYANNLKASLQNIEDEIMGFVTRLSRGDKLTAQEQKRLDALGKQYNSVNKNYTNTLAEGNKILATMPKQTKASIGSTKDNGKAVVEDEGKTVLRDYAAEIASAGRAIAKMGKPERLALAQKLKAAGYNVPTDGNYSDQLISGYIQAIADNQIRSTNFEREIPMLEFLGLRQSEGPGAVPGAGGGGPEVSIYPTITNRQDGRITINKYFQDNFGRDATNDEFEEAYAKIIAEQKAKPTKRVAKKNAKGETIYETTGGTNTEQILNNFVGSKKNLKDEKDTYEASDAAVLKRQEDKKEYDKALAAAGNDPAKIAALNASSAYGRSIASMQNKIARLALESGAQFTDAELAAIAKEAIDTSLDTDAESLTAFINSKMKFKPGAKGAYTGVAGENVDALTKVAAANGLDLNKAFGAQLPDWLNAINKGESIETYKKIIRDVAKIGMPEKVAKLIDQGVDLATIYSPYKNLMASTLEINPETIDMNDATLRSAITADKEIPLYEFERSLRQDNRWQYTNQAKEEVSNATRKILQDFGFMG
jgi:hypothetical protein